MATNVELQHALTLESDPGPFVSIFMPLNATVQDTPKDRSQFNSLLSQAKQAFLADHTAKEWKPYDAAFSKFLSDPLGNNTAKGLAIYVGQQTAHSFKLKVPVESAFNISSTIQILPLIKDGQLNTDFDLLLLRRDSFQLYHVVDSQIEKAELPEDAPTTLEGALGSDLTGGSQRQRSTGLGGGTTFNGTDTRDNTEYSDQRNYFTMVDDYVFNHFSKVNQLPLVLAAVVEDQGNFRKVAKNIYLSKEVRLNKVPSVQTQKQELLDLMKEANEQFEAAAIDDLHAAYDKALGGKRATDDIADLMTSAVAGQVATLFVQDEAFVAGQVTETSVDTTSDASKKNNLLNDLAITVAGFGGNVYVLASDQMPSDQPAAAILRGNLAE